MDSAETDNDTRDTTHDTTANDELYFDRHPMPHHVPDKVRRVQRFLDAQPGDQRIVLVTVSVLGGGG